MADGPPGPDADAAPPGDRALRKPALSQPDREWRRRLLRWILFGGMGLVGLYEYALRYPHEPSFDQHLDDLHELLGGEDHAHHARFARDLHEARAEELDFTLEDVREEFKDKYTDRARSLLCSGCKLTSARIGEELDSRGATHQPDPGALLNVTKDAVAAACEELPSSLMVSSGKKAAVFFVHEAEGGKAISGVERRKSEVARRSAQRLCQVLLADAKIAMLEALIRRKVPHSRHHGPGEAANDNWERWLCARQARLCKRSEVEDDDEDEAEEGEL